MNNDFSLTQTFLQLAGTDTPESWSNAIRLSKTSGVTKASLIKTFADVVALAPNTPIADLGLNTLLLAYGKLLHDKKLPPEVRQRLLGPLSEALVQSLINTPAQENEKGQLVRSSTHYTKARKSSRLSDEEVSQINRVTGQITKRWQYSPA